MGGRGMDARLRRLRRLGMIGALCLGLLAPTWGGEALRFVAGVDDLPLAPGVEETPGAVVFDKPDGRIVEADARGRVRAAAVRGFYSSVLPAFGWTEAGELSFVRGDEALRIEIAERGGALAVHFSIAPRRP